MINFVKLGDLVVNPEDISYYLKYVHQPDDDPERQKFLGNLLGNEKHNTQISFKNGGTVWTSLTVAEITELLEKGINENV